jgi:hypothetical protein
LGNLVKAKLTLVFGNSLKIDGLKFDLLEENFPISHFQNPKLTTTWFKTDKFCENIYLIFRNKKPGWPDYIPAFIK